jgi:hypothetical protein
MLTNINTEKWVKNTLLFLRPVLLIYFGFIATNLDDGFGLMDFVPNEFILGGMSLYLINVTTDYLQKLDKEAEIKIDMKVNSVVAQEIETDERIEEIPKKEFYPDNGQI